MNKIAAVFLILILSGCIHQLPVKEEKTVTRQNLSSPFKIEMQYSQSILSAWISNQSDKEQMFLYDSKIQPSRIILIYGGKELQSFDARQIMKYNNTVERKMFQTLAPLEKKKLYESRLAPGKAFYWGTYQFKNLPAGKYQVFLEWTSSIRAYYDYEAKKSQSIEVWTDENPVYSNEIEVDL